MKKYKITKLPDGFAKGCDTYGNMCRPKGGSSGSRATELKSRASSRILKLMKLGSQADNMTRKEEPITDEKQLNNLQFHNEFAESPKIVQFAYWRSILDERRKELKELEETNNKRKFDLISPTIKTQIEIAEKAMRELFDEIKQERKLISRIQNTGE